MRVCGIVCLYLLSKIHKCLSDVQTVISNCGTPMEKVSEFLNSQLILVMQEGWSYVKDPGDFIKKPKILIIFHRML